MRVKTAKWTSESKSTVVARFLERPAFDPVAERVAADVLAAVRREGDAAVARYARQFDGAVLRSADFRVAPREIRAAAHEVPRPVRAAIREADRRIAAFCRGGRKRKWSMATGHGGMLGEQFVPFDRVGVYVPGGQAPLVSTALMTATLARVAGVPEIVACTPCGRDGMVNPALLFALATAGATEVYRIGGIQAIGLLAYGTRTVKPVQKIAGPGNAYVTAAKRQVYGTVALDLVAGPSELAVLADDSADPRHVAADLLSQAEHGTGAEKALLVTVSRRLLDEVRSELHRQSRVLSHRNAVQTVMRTGTLLVEVPDLDTGIELCNRFAPEHLELVVRRPRQWLRKVRAAGAVFLGPWTPESAGDFVAGPSHVLPTGGAAARFSGLTVDDFLRRISFMEFRRADLEDALPVIEQFGAVEGLDAHVLSARIRLGG